MSSLLLVLSYAFSSRHDAIMSAYRYISRPLLCSSHVSFSSDSTSPPVIWSMLAAHKMLLNLSK